MAVELAPSVRLVVELHLDSAVGSWAAPAPVPGSGSEEMSVSTPTVASVTVASAIAASDFFASAVALASSTALFGLHPSGSCCLEKRSAPAAFAVPAFASGATTADVFAESSATGRASMTAKDAVELVKWKTMGFRCSLGDYYFPCSSVDSTYLSRSVKANKTMYDQ